MDFWSFRCPTECISGCQLRSQFRFLSSVYRNVIPKVEFVRNYYNHQSVVINSVVVKCWTWKEKKREKKLHMLEIELEYQRHARKLYLYNYIFRHSEWESSENPARHAAWSKLAKWTHYRILVGSDFNRNINILFVIKRVLDSYQSNVSFASECMGTTQPGFVHSSTAILDCGLIDRKRAPKRKPDINQSLCDSPHLHNSN